MCYGVWSELGHRFPVVVASRVGLLEEWIGIVKGELHQLAVICSIWYSQKELRPSTGSLAGEMEARLLSNST